MSDEPLPATRARTFVLRVVPGEQGDCHGQAGEPGSLDEWHTTFASLEELWGSLRGRLAALSGANSPLPTSGMADPSVEN